MKLTFPLVLSVLHGTGGKIASGLQIDVSGEASKKHRMETVGLSEPSGILYTKI